MLKDPAEARAYLRAAFDDGEPEYILIALNKVAKAQGGFSKLALKTGLSRENLYTALSPDGNPRFDSITKVLHALGLRMSVESLKPRKTARSSRGRSAKPNPHAKSSVRSTARTSKTSRAKAR